jgi:peptidyl-prolyl cis-trans isomerase B (cyclophilin B)
MPKKINKRVLYLILILTFLAASISYKALSAEKKISGKDSGGLEKLKKTKAVIETKFGNIEIKFFPEVAPNHVRNFIKLAKDGVYNGTIFHRVIPGFMVQGGDPNTKGPNKESYGMGGPGYTVKAEFNNISHKRGILSMARAMDPDSAGSQFFIVVADSTFLDKQYTVFGEVAKGMEVADKIVNLPRNRNDLPDERIEIKVKIIE